MEGAEEWAEQEVYSPSYQGEGAGQEEDHKGLGDLAFVETKNGVIDLAIWGFASIHCRF